MQPTNQSVSGQQHDHIPSGQDPQASSGQVAVQPALGQPTIRNRPLVPALHLGGTSPVKATARGGAGLPRASSTPDATPKDLSQNDAAPDQPARGAEGGSKRTIDGKDGPGSRESKASKRQRGNPTDEHHPAEVAGAARFTVYEDKPTEKKLVRIRRETDLKERGKLSPRRTAPDSPLADGLQATPASTGTAASTAQSGNAAWRRSSQASKPDTGKASKITLSPRRASDAVHVGASQPGCKADLATTSLPVLPHAVDDPMFNDSFSFAPCDEDEHGAIDARSPLPALATDASPRAAPLPEGSSGNAADMPAPASGSQPVAPSPAPPAMARFPSGTLAMLESVLKDWEEQMPAGSDKPN